MPEPNREKYGDLSKKIVEIWWLELFFKKHIFSHFEISYKQVNKFSQKKKCWATLLSAHSPWDLGSTLGWKGSPYTKHP